MRAINSARRDVKSEAKAKILGALGALALVGVLAGCGDLGFRGLPGGLPIPPGTGGGSLTITTLVLVDAISGRAYDASVATSGGSGVLASNGCTIQSGALPPGISVAPEGVLAASRCRLTGTPTASGTFNFTLQATDNAATPSSGTRGFSFVVRGEFTLSGPPAEPNPAGVPAPAIYGANELADGAVGRAYGTAAGKTRPTATANVAAAAGASDSGQTTEIGNGPLVTCAIVANADFVLAPAVSGGTGCPLGSTGNLTIAGNVAVTYTVTDNQILDPVSGRVAVPARTTSINRTLIVRAAATATLTQATNATPNTALLPAVSGRTYGTIGAPPTYSGTGGLGLRNAALFRWCISAGALPAGFVSAPVISTNCATPTATPGNVTVTANPAGAAAAATAFTLQFDDTGNSAVVPSTATAATQITVNAALASTLAQTTNATPNTALLNGITGRTYGIIGAPPTYTATGGLGTYRWCFSAGALPAGFVTAPAISAACGAPTAAAGPVTVTANPAGAPGGPTAFTVQVDDTGNAAVPVANSTQATNLTVIAGLTSTLTQAGNATPNTALFNAVTGRTYAIGGQAGAAPTYSAAGGGGAAAYRWCVSAGALPAGFATSPAISTNCAAPTTNPGPITVSANPAGAAGGPTAFTLQVDDGATANAAVPSGASTQATQLTINAGVLVAVVPDPAVNNAVTGRAYGDAPQATPTYTATGGDGLYTFTVSAGAPPTGINCTQVAQTMICRTGGGTVTGATAAYTVQAADAGNGAVPGGAGTLAKTITVNAALAIAVNQANPLNQAVQGRAYGTGALIPIQFTASNGLGGYSFAQTGTALPAGFACATATPNFTCSANTVTGATANGIVVTVTDTANATTPAGSTPSANRDLTVNPEISFTATTVTGPTPTGVFAPGVQGRRYGAPLTDIVFAANGGLNGTLGLTVTATGTVLANGIACTPSGAQAPSAAPVLVICNSAGVALVAPTGTRTLNFDASDVGNPSVPPNTISTDAAGYTDYTLDVNANLTIAGNQALQLNDAVKGRNYGIGGFTPVQYTAAGGLGPYNFLNPGTSNLPSPQFPSGFICATVTTQFTCTAAPVSVAVVAGAFNNIPVTVNDTANISTPDALSTGTQPAPVLRNLNVRDEITFSVTSPVVGGGAPNGTLPDGVLGRTYGTPLTDVVFNATGGLGPSAGLITMVGGSFTGAGGLICTPLGLQPPAASVNVTCNSGGAGLPGVPGLRLLTFTVSDAGNASTTPSALITTDNAGFTNYTANINAALTIALAGGSPDPNNAATSAAVQGRTYGAPAATDVVYQASGGLGGYTLTPSGAGTLPTGIVATPNNGLGIVTINSQNNPVTGTTTNTFTIAVTDTANSTTPQSGAATGPHTFTVNNALTITTTQANLVNALLNFPYNPPGPGVTFAATGGIGAQSWFAGAAGGGACPGGAGALPTGITVTTGTGLVSGSATAASATATDFTFDMCVSDTANSTTPAGFDLDPNFLINVLGQKAYVTNTSDTVEVISTNPGAAVTSIAITAGDLPEGVAIRPDGRRAYVVAGGAATVRVIDTISDTLVSSIALPGCTLPRRVTTGVIPAIGPRAYVTCSNSVVAIIDASTDAFISVTGALGAGGGVLVGLTLNPGGTRLYIVDQTNDDLITVSTATNAEVPGSSPIDLTGQGVTVPTAIVCDLNCANLYIAGSGSNNVGVQSTVEPLSVTLVTIITANIGTVPNDLALTPDGSRVYVANFSSDDFSVIATATNTATLIALTAGDNPTGVTIPPLNPVPGTGVRVYIALNGAASVSIRDDSPVTFPANAASPIALAGTVPSLIAHIKVPQ